VIIGEPNEHGIGEIRVKGPNVTQGYYKDEEHTKELFDQDGYLRTGDLGYMDSESYVYLKGRAKNLIVTEGGKNVYPEEIEDMFQLYPEIQQILIRGYQEKKDVPSESIEAVIFPSPELKNPARIDAIIREVNAKLSGYKKISKVTILDKPMEMTTTQKIKRNLVS
jgi:long-chain acyl-CoA synthetase